MNSLLSLTVAAQGAPNPPHALLENTSAFSIVMNLLGINESDITVRVNESQREVTILAKKDSVNTKRGFFWIFAVPADGLLEEISTRFKAGVLEINIPKYSLNSAA